MDCIKRIFGTNLFACTFLALFIFSCKPEPVITPKEDDVRLPRVYLASNYNTIFRFRLFSTDSVDLFQSGSPYNFNENYDSIVTYIVLYHQYIGEEKDRVSMMYHAGWESPKQIWFNNYHYPECDTTFNYMDVRTTGGDQAGCILSSTMYIQWNSHDFDTVYTTYIKQMGNNTPPPYGLPPSPYGYWLADSIYYNNKLVYTWQQVIDENPCGYAKVYKDVNAAYNNKRENIND
jgi:hypothetical protein